MISMPAVFVQFSFMAKSLLILWPLVWVLWGCDEPQPAAQPAANRKTAVKTVVQPTTPTVTYKYLKNPPEWNSDAFPPDFDYNAGDQAMVVKELKSKYSADIEGHTEIPRFFDFRGAIKDIPGAADMIKKVERVWKVWHELSPVRKSAAENIARSIQNVVYDWVGQHFQFDNFDNVMFVRDLSKWLEPLASCEILFVYVWDIAKMCKFAPKNSALFTPKAGDGLESQKRAIAKRHLSHGGGSAYQYAIPEDLEKRLPSGLKYGFCSEFNRRAVKHAIEKYSYWYVLSPEVIQNLDQLIINKEDLFSGKPPLILRIKDGDWIDDKGPPKCITDLREFLWPTPAGTGERLGFFLLLIASVALVVLLRSAQLPILAQYTEIDLTSSLQSVL